MKKNKTGYVYKIFKINRFKIISLNFFLLLWEMHSSGHSDQKIQSEYKNIRHLNQISSLVQLKLLKYSYFEIMANNLFYLKKKKISLKAWEKLFVRNK